MAMTIVPATWANKAGYQNIPEPGLDFGQNHGEPLSTDGRGDATIACQYISCKGGISEARYLN